MAFQERGYGRLPKGKKSYKDNQLDEIYGRAGNRLLRELQTWRYDPKIGEYQPKRPQTNMPKVADASRRLPTRHEVPSHHSFQRSTYVVQRLQMELRGVAQRMTQDIEKKRNERQYAQMERQMAYEQGASYER